METEEFMSWLDKVSEQFLGISDSQRNTVLDKLIDNSTSDQLHHLSEKLPLLVKRDFIKLLPVELVEHLLHFLDGKTLLKCCLVSQTWNKTISQSHRAWRRSCITEGTDEDYVQFKQRGHSHSEIFPLKDARTLKITFLETLAKLQELKSDQTFSRVILKGHQSRIMAVFYNHGKVATGCDDRTVRLWEVSTGKCLLKLSTSSVSDVIFDDNFILTASFDNTAACWDLQTGSLIQTYIGHVAAVFSVDFDGKRDIVVTGAADRVIILWRLSSGELLHYISGHHTGWVMKVKLLPQVTSTNVELISACSNTAFRWTIVKEEESYCISDVVPVHNPPANFCLHQSFEVRNKMSSFYLSDHSAREGYLYCCPTNPSSRSLKQSCKMVHLNGTHDVLLGIGKRFAIFVDFQDTDTVKIVDLIKKETVAQHYLPPCRPSRNGSTFTLGPSDWLNGVGQKTEGLFLAACLKSNDVLLLKWKVR